MFLAGDRPEASDGAGIVPAWVILFPAAVSPKTGACYKVRRPEFPE